MLPEVLTNRPPQVSLEEIASLAACFGVQGIAVELSSERDQNVRIDAANGQRYILKITNPAEPIAVTAFESEVLEHVALHAGQLPTPRLIRALDGANVLRRRVGDRERTVRLLSYLEGVPLASVTSSPALRRSIGATLAALDRGIGSLARGDHQRDLLWDFSQASSLRELLVDVADSSLRTRLAGALDRLESCELARRPDLRPQWLHNDFNPFNLLVAADDPTRITGIIDFGDLAYGPVVCDLAVACAYAMRGAEPLEAVADVVEGFSTQIALGEAELDLLPVLMDARFTMTVLITRWRAALNPHNSTYILRNCSAALAGLDALEASGASFGALIRERLGIGRK